MKKIYTFLSFFLVFVVNAQYQRSIIANTNTAGAYGLLEKDVDGDGIIDLLGASEIDNTVSYFINDGSGHFTQTIIDNDLTGARFIDGADFDGDGDMDFAATGSTELVWYRNDNGTFVKTIVASGLNDPRQVRLIDVGSLLDPGTPDGDIDIGILKSGDNAASLYMNDGSNNFSLLNIISISDPRYLHGGDFNSDGTDDLVVTSYTNNQIVWYKLGSFGFVEAGTIVTGFNGAFGVEGGDIDLDGDDDIIATAFLDNEVAWFENTDGTGTNFTKHTIDNNLPGASYVHWLDIDNDGDKDIVATGYGTTSGGSVTNSQVVIYYNDGAQNFTKTIIDTASLGAATFSVQDFNGDNQYDIAVAASASNEFVLLSQNTGAISNQRLQTIRLYPNPVKGQFFVRPEESIRKIQIFDITGRQIINTTQYQIDMQAYPNGYYLVKISLKDGEDITKKILVLH